MNLVAYLDATWGDAGGGRAPRKQAVSPERPKKQREPAYAEGTEDKGTVELERQVESVEHRAPTPPAANAPTIDANLSQPAEEERADPRLMEVLQCVSEPQSGGRSEGTQINPHGHGGVDELQQGLSRALPPRVQPSANPMDDPPPL